MTYWNRPAFFAVCVLFAADLVGSATAGLPTDPAQIDACQYPDTAAAQAVWVPMGGSSPVSMEKTGDGQSLRKEAGR